MIYYGYKHWTLEQYPRCFYVGKGKITRPFDTVHRNRKWHGIVKRLGLYIEVCVGPISEEKAFQWETYNIVEEGTFTNNYHYNDDNDIGCNFTYGGDGAAGRVVNAEERKRRSLSAKIAQNTPEAKLAHSKASMGRKFSNESKQRSSKTIKQKYDTDKTYKERVRLGTKNAMQRPDVKEKVKLKQKELWTRQSFRKKQKETRTVLYNSVEYHEKMSNSIKKLWHDEQYREKQ